MSLCLDQPHIWGMVVHSGGAGQVMGCRWWFRGLVLDVGGHSRSLKPVRGASALVSWSEASS